jgi:hypothetical protein
MLSSFQVVEIPKKTTIAAQGERLDQLHGTQAGIDPSLPIRELYLDFITRGSVQLVRKACFRSTVPRTSTKDGGKRVRESAAKIGRGDRGGGMDANEAHEVPVYKHLPLIEFSEGDCYTALDIYGGRDRWTCSAVATTDVEVVRIVFRDFRNLIAPQVLPLGQLHGFCIAPLHFPSLRHTAPGCWMPAFALRGATCSNNVSIC